MLSSVLLFVYRSLCSRSKLILFILLLRVVGIDGTVDHSRDERWKRAIGGESLDSSNFVLYEDPSTGFKYIEVPYEYMEQWLNDQRMWRTWSIALAILAIIFLGTLIFFVIHSYRTMTGPFSLCAKHLDDQPSEDKMSSSELPDYPMTGNMAMFHSSAASPPHPFLAMKSNPVPMI